MTMQGHNNPPRYEAFAMALEDVRLEAGNYLDGATVETQEQADAIGVIMGQARDIKRDADKARTEDKKPHLDAGRKVDDNYKAVLQTADDIVKAAQGPLSVFLTEQARVQEELRVKAKREADRAAQEAIAAERAAAGNIEALEAAREKQLAADDAQKASVIADKAKPRVAGSGRAISLRTRQVAVVTNYRALLLHIAGTDKPALDAFLDEYARKALPSQLPGVRIDTERSVA